VFLTLNDDLLSAIDELVTALLGEILVRQEGFDMIVLFADTIFMLLGDLVGETVL
jgi:hypothetical protein